MEGVLRRKEWMRKVEVMPEGRIAKVVYSERCMERDQEMGG